MILKKIKKILIFFTIMFFLFIVLSILSFFLNVRTYNITTDKVTTPAKILQISDLHSCYYGKDMSTLIDVVKKENPDIIALTGDIYDEIVDNTNTRIFLKYCGENYPTYYIAGNHEEYNPDWAENNKEAESFGITILSGDSISCGEIIINGAGLLPNSDVNFKDTVKSCAQQVSSDTYNILLSHYPIYIDYYKSFNKFDLVLAGHTHGGQWRIPFLVNGLFTYEEGFFPKYAGGEYDFENCNMIISRGLSRSKSRIPRIFNNPEVVVINIHPEK